MLFMGRFAVRTTDHPLAAELLRTPLARSPRPGPAGLGVEGAGSRRRVLSGSCVEPHGASFARKKARGGGPARGRARRSVGSAAGRIIRGPAPRRNPARSPRNAPSARSGGQAAPTPPGRFGSSRRAPGSIPSIGFGVPAVGYPAERGPPVPSRGLRRPPVSDARRACGRGPCDLFATDPRRRIRRERCGFGPGGGAKGTGGGHRPPRGTGAAGSRRPRPGRAVPAYTRPKLVGSRYSPPPVSISPPTNGETAARTSSMVSAAGKASAA